MLLSLLSNSGVLMTKAYSFWTQQGTSKLKSDNHFYRQCFIRALNVLRADAIPVQITDGAPTQFKNRFNAVQLCNLVRMFDLDWPWPPTATFKGEHGNAHHGDTVSGILTRDSSDKAS